MTEVEESFDEDPPQIADILKALFPSLQHGAPEDAKPSPLAGVDRYLVEENLEIGAERVAKLVPSRYLGAAPATAEVRAWVDEMVELACRHHRPIVRSGPSLLLLGGTGTGKTHEAYGAVIALSNSGVACRWTFATAADMYGRLRPRPRTDSEDEYLRFASAPLLVLDDLGAAKASEWTEEINYRVINYRYEHELPTLVTSNVTPKELRAALGERVASRLVEMADRVVLTGGDRRRKE
jgi:DNA replication protein DnaC